jgi:hypothetical protein
MNTLPTLAGRLHFLRHGFTREHKSQFFIENHAVSYWPLACLFVTVVSSLSVEYLAIHSLASLTAISPLRYRFI